uniref:Uncharacterized protein n=1 Tax=Sinocyclocheilus rhinocerous TaxID=307959 RepID=A0A673L7R7_9TELE
MMVALPNGTVVHHINANNFLDQTSMKPEEEEGPTISFSAGFEDPSTSTYIRFLQEGLEMARPYLESFGFQLKHTAAGKLNITFFVFYKLNIMQKAHMHSRLILSTTFKLKTRVETGRNTRFKM